MGIRVTQTTTEQSNEAREGFPPISVTFTAPEDRDVQMRVSPRGQAAFDDQSRTAANNSSYDAVRQPTIADFLALTTWSQTLQNNQQQQLAILKEIDARLARLEEYTRPSPTSNTYERASWWALWGVLMLILGAALVILILLIVTQNHLGSLLP